MLAWLLLIGSLVHAGPVFIDLQDAQTLLAEGAAVIDARGEAAWKDGHLPDSWPLDWTHHRQGWRKSGLLTDDTTALEKALEKAGVRDDQSVLVIGAGRDGWGEEGRWYWALEYLGHPSVHVFNGGWPAWVAAGGATTLESRPPIRGSFTPRIEPSRRARTEEVAQASRTGTTLVWDTREDREYTGETPYGEARGGHIPGAAGLWYGDLLGPDGRLLPDEEMRSLLASHGIRPETSIITTCTGGVRSGFAYAVLRHLGYPQVANYDGSMWEWSADGGRPLTSERPQSR